MSQTLGDESEVVFDQPEERAGSMEPDGSVPNRRKEEWLEATEPYLGARPRTTEFDWLVDEGLGATSGGLEDDVKLRDGVVQRLRPEQQIRQEEEVHTPPRKEPRRNEGHQPRGPRAMTDDSMLGSGDLAGQRKDIAGRNRPNNEWSPVAALEDTVSRMQRDFEDLQTQNQFLRTPRAPGPVPLVRQAVLTTTKVPWFNGSTSWEQYQQVFDATVLSNGWEDATAAVKAFGDIGQTVRLRLIRDQLIAGHESCELRRHLDCLPPDTPLRDIVDRCRVWESHSDSSVRRVSKPMLEPAFPAYMIKKSEHDPDPIRTVTVNKPERSVDDSELLRKLVEILTPVAPAPARAPEPSVMDKLVQLLMEKVATRKPVSPAPAEPTKLETRLQTYIKGKQLPNQQFRPRPVRRKVFLMRENGP